MNFGSLFSGIGGLDLGLEQAGLHCVWQCEINPHATQILQKHWPNVPRWQDVRTLLDPPPCDLIAGGFPCKQTSTAAAVHGRRQGLDGTDSGLWYEMLLVVRLARPRWVVVENVSGAARWSVQISRGLAEAGYRVPREPVRLSAADFGAPHRRRRLFWVADLDGQGLQIPRQVGPRPAAGFTRGAAHRNPWLQTLRRVVRVADGVPGRPHRRQLIECLGNAVVPAMGRWLGERILEATKL